MSTLPPPLLLALLLLLLASSVLGNTVLTSQELITTTKALSFADEPRSIRFGQSPARNSLYEASALSKRHFKHGFGDKLGPILRSLLPHNFDEEMKEHMIQHHMIPMRDGVKLSTLVIFPLHMKQDGSDKRSAMMSRSPYAPTSDQIANVFTILNGMVALVQDQRGTFLSEGEFTMWTHDAEDGEDTVNWVLAQPWSNGKVFGAGISADGCSLASMFRLQPAPKLAGALYMWASANGHATTYPGGSFRAGLISGWMVLQSFLTKGTSLTKTLPQLLENWKLERNGFWEPIQGPGKWHQVNWPTVHITAWSDIFQGLQINMYNQFRAHAPQHEHRLIVGPLGHCILGLPPKGDALLGLVDARAIQIGFGYSAELFGGFEQRGTLFRDMLDMINIYVQGSRQVSGESKVGHYWSSFAQWPKPTNRLLYLHAQRRMFLDQSPSPSNNHLRQAGKPVRDLDYVEYVYDPQYPVHTRGGNNLVLHLLGFGCGNVDQREIEKRADVVTFDLTEPLEEPLALTGEVKAVLYVSTDAKDTDFYVSLNDVHPEDKYSVQIRSGLQRLRLKDSTEFETRVTEITPNAVYKIEVSMWFTSYIVARGHKLRVAVTSSNTPYYAQNANNANERDQYGLKTSVVANNRVYFTDKYPSHVVLPVVSLEALPKNYRI